MNRTISFALLAGGIILLMVGINAYNSTSSDISRFFTGAATDKSIWYLVGGAVAAVLGLVGVSLGRKSV